MLYFVVLVDKLVLRPLKVSMSRAREIVFKRILLVWAPWAYDIVYTYLGPFKLQRAVKQFPWITKRVKHMIETRSVVWDSYLVIENEVIFQIYKA